MLPLLTVCLAVTYASYASSADPKPVQSCCELAGQLLQTNQALHKELTQLKSSIACRSKGSSSTGSSSKPASSCGEVHKDRKDAPSGVYYIRSGRKVEQVYCHMDSLGSCGSGGWTTLVKVDGRKTTFGYRSRKWTDTSVYNVQGGSTGFDDQETKLNTYSYMPFKKLCVVFKNPSSGRTGYVLISKMASSLLSVIKTNKFSAVSVSKSTWLNSIPGASLQNSCNRNGFNAISSEPNHARARIGIISNDGGARDCHTSDSALGVGISGRGCGCNACDKLSAGNYNGCKSHYRLPTYAYVLAQ